MMAYRLKDLAKWLVSDIDKMLYRQLKNDIKKLFDQ